MQETKGRAQGPPLHFLRHDTYACAGMALSEDLIKKLSAKFPPGEMSDFKYRGKDATIKADEAGNAILLFLGKRMENGHIKGERYARRLLFDGDGKTLKEHWEMLGKSA